MTLRWILLFAGLGLAGCAPRAAGKIASHDIVIHVDRVAGASRTEPTAYFRITNKSPRRQCLASDLINNVQSGSIFVRVRFGGKEVPNRNSGYPPEPIPGEFPIEPGKDIVIAVRLDKKLAANGAAFTSTNKLSVAASVEYWECGTQRGMWATSSWKEVPLEQ